MKAIQLLKIKKAPQMLPKIIKLRLISRKIIDIPQTFNNFTKVPEISKKIKWHKTHKCHGNDQNTFRIIGFTKLTINQSQGSTIYSLCFSWIWPNGCAKFQSLARQHVCINLTS